MGNRLVHRGPDQRGDFADGPVILGSTRLSIVDVANGRQPVVRERDGRRYAIVYNGEIYNHADLRRDLASCRVHPETHCDTELLLLAYMAFGESCVERLDGQFAFAIMDVSERKLFLGRDPAGIKPLFYTWLDGAFLFASEPKAILSFPGMPRVPDREAIGEYFLHGYAFASGYVTGERSFYEGIHAVPPAHVLTVADGGMQKRCYWSPPAPDKSAMTPTEWANAVREIMDRRIADYVSDEVPLGVALSGGIDSSIIAVLATREMNHRNKDLVACSIFYEGQQPNEDYRHAEIVAASLRERGQHLRFERSVLTPDDYLSELDKMLWHFDEPHWEVKQLAMFRNYRRLKECGAKVVLTGEGADELFFGYFRKFPGFRNPRLANAEELKALWATRMPHVVDIFAEQSRPTMRVTLERLMDESVARYYSDAWDINVDPEKRMQHWYFRTFLTWLLTVNDRCSMAFSLEGRFPFLDKELIELAFRMPSTINTIGAGKNVLRDPYVDLLPEAIRLREKSPLPSPQDSVFHKVIQQALAMEIRRSAGSPVWQILSRRSAEELSSRFAARLAGLGDDTGPLTSYMNLSDPLDFKTVHAFSLLTLLRWYHINFEGGDHAFC